MCTELYGVRIMKCLVKKTLTVLLATLLCGCGGKSEKESNDSMDNNVSAVTESEAKPERKVIEYDPDKPVIALTFDDGPNTTITPRVLDRLEQYNAAATFFLIGSNMNDESVEVAKRAYYMGCDIENHSFSHPAMTDLSVDEINEQISKTDELIYGITGEYPKFFRPPYIAVNDTMFENIDKVFICGYGVEDYNANVTAQQRADGVLKQAKDGAIILLHDMENNYQTIEALDTIIPALIDEGYQLVTVSQLFEAKGIDPENGEKILFSFAEQTSMYG